MSDLEKAKERLRIYLETGKMQAAHALEVFEAGDIHEAMEMAARTAGTFGSIALFDNLAELRESVGWRPKTLEELTAAHEKWRADTAALLADIAQSRQQNGGAE